MHDIITPKSFNPGPDFHKQLEGGMFTFTLESKTGKKKIVKEHNQLGAVNNVLEIISKYARALPWMALNNTTPYGAQYPTAFRNYLKTDNWIGINQFIGVDGTTDIVGTDTKFKGNDIVGWALSTTQNAGPRSGILSRSTTTNSTKDGFKLQRQFTFPAGKGTGIYTGGYLVRDISYGYRSIGASGGSSSSSAASGSAFGPWSNSRGNGGVKFAPIFGQGQKFFDALSGTTINYLDAANLSLSEGLFPNESIWCFAKKSTPPWAYALPAKNGFSAVTAANKYPVHAQTKAYSAGAPYDVRIADFQGNITYITLDEATYAPSFVGMCMISNNQLAIKFSKRQLPASPTTYNTYNIICTLSNGGVISSYSKQTPTSGVNYLPFTIPRMPNYLYTDIFINFLSGYAFIDEYGSISIAEWLANPNGAQTDAQFSRYTGTNIDATNNTCILESFSWVQERRARGGFFMPYEGYWNQFDFLDINSDICISASSGSGGTYTSSMSGSSLVFCCRKTSPFFSCVQLGTPIAKDTTDVLTVDYELTVNSPFLGGLL